MLGKKGKSGGDFTNIGIVVLIGLVAWIGIGMMETEEQSVGDGDAPDVGDIGGVVGCAIDDTVLTMSNVNKYTRGTNPYMHTRLLLENNGLATDLGLFAPSGTKTLSPGDNVIAYVGENSTSYYTQKVDKTMPCSGTDTIQGELAAFDTSVSFTYWNEDGTANTAQAMGADDEYNIEFKMKVTGDTCFGNPQVSRDNVICVNYNTSVMDAVEVQDRNGARRPIASIPRTVNDALPDGAAAGSGIGRSIACYTFPVTCDGDEWEGQLFVDTASTQPSAVEHTINVTIEDVDYDLDADTLAEIIGAEDEDFNDLGTTIQKFPVQVS